MSAMTDTAVETVSARSSRATREFCAALGLDNVKPKDLTLLTIALAEVATREIQSNTEFASRVRDAFQTMTANSPKASPPKKGKSTKADAFEALIPIGPVDLSRLRPSGAIDPFALYEAYGKTQAVRVIKGLTLDNLKQSASIVEQHVPGTKPASRTAKKALIDYIVRYVAGA